MIAPASGLNAAISQILSEMRGVFASLPPFTPEQEARVAEIVVAILEGIEAHDSAIKAEAYRSAVAWGRHNAGFGEKSDG